MQWVEVAQAVTIERFGPVMCCMMLAWPEVMLMMLAGIKNGETLRGPQARSLVVIFFDGLDATDTGTHSNTDGVSIFML